MKGFGCRGYGTRWAVRPGGLRNRRGQGVVSLPPFPSDVPPPRSSIAGAPLYDGRRHGVYLTPADLVETALDLAIPHLGRGLLTVVDPSCGDGAFLAAAGARLPSARLLGLELSVALARQARARVPRARVLVGDGLREGWAALEA